MSIGTEIGCGFSNSLMLNSKCYGFEGDETNKNSAHLMTRVELDISRDLYNINSTTPF